ncbi:MAG: LptF/LptG family permease [Chthoniobacter sp.]|uniref:LptF/LptG family permease n=1 Tax=Chthoniobacter sp. TaxID=2510640 RepID=UPI0032A8D294
MSLLDRYVLRSFLEPFLMCFAGFIAIWFIIDIQDNFNDFMEAHATFKQISGYYITQVPQTIMMSLPVGLMLALLFSLSRMSRTNEIISQLTAGRSVVRVLVPLFAVGVLMTGFCLWLNWDRAPHAEGIKKNAMNQIKRGKKAGTVEPILAHLFRDRQNNRTWFVRKLRPGENRLDGVHVTQQDPTGRILKKWYASSATYDPVKKEWKIEKGMIVNFTPEGDMIDSEADRFPSGFRIIKDWTETPWRVASSELNPASLSVPELQEYMKFNSDFPPVQLAPYEANLADRYALPFQCIIAVLLAAPLGIVFNRRGVVGGVAAAITLLVAMLMSHSFFLMLGKSMRLSPYFSPWIPNIALGIVGFLLLWYRSTNRDFPKFTFSLRR